MVCTSRRAASPTGATTDGPVQSLVLMSTRISPRIASRPVGCGRMTGARLAHSPQECSQPPSLDRQTTAHAGGCSRTHTRMMACPPASASSSEAKLTELTSSPVHWPSRSRGQNCGARQHKGHGRPQTGGRGGRHGRTLAECTAHLPTDVGVLPPRQWLSGIGGIWEQWRQRRGRLHHICSEHRSGFQTNDTAHAPAAQHAQAQRGRQAWGPRALRATGVRHVAMGSSRGRHTPCRVREPSSAASSSKRRRGSLKVSCGQLVLHHIICSQGRMVCGSACTTGCKRGVQQGRRAAAAVASCLV